MRVFLSLSICISRDAVMRANESHCVMLLGNNPPKSFVPLTESECAEIRAHVYDSISLLRLQIEACFSRENINVASFLLSKGNDCV